MFRCMYSMIAAVLISAGCEKGYGPLDGDAAFWFPMQPGSSWLYGAGGFLLIDQDLFDITGARVVTVIGDTLHEVGFPLLAVSISDSLVYTPVGGGDAFTEQGADTVFFLSTGSGVFFYEALDCEAHQTRMLLPIIPGNQWEDGEEQSTVVGGSECAQGPDGVWSDCVQIRTHSPTMPGQACGTSSGYWYRIDRFYAGGIGLVREELLGDGGVGDSAELVFTLVDSGV